MECAPNAEQKPFMQKSWEAHKDPVCVAWALLLARWEKGLIHAMKLQKHLKLLRESKRRGGGHMVGCYDE